MQCELSWCSRSLRRSTRSRRTRRLLQQQPTPILNPCGSAVLIGGRVGDKQMQSHISRNKVCYIFPHAEVCVTPDEIRQDPKEYAWASGIIQFLLLSRALLDRCYWTKVIHKESAFRSAFCCSTRRPARLLLAQQRLHQPKCYQAPDTQQWLRPEPYAGVYCERTPVASF